MKARSVVLAALLLANLLPAGAQTAEHWITLARARLGSESALSGVTSIRFTGTIVADGASPRSLDIIFQKPLQQRITLAGTELSEVIALDDYSGWQQRSNPQNPAQWQMTLLDAPQIKRLRAQAWDNLNFLRNYEQLNGTVALVDGVTADGQACVKLIFSYYGGITLTRYYDKATARLVKTETESGTEIREEGEMFAEGIRFPRKVTNRDRNGRAVTMTFEKIVLNARYPASEFAVPVVPTN
jgi:outer membrane lipoprotein-sorting protein